VQAVDFRAGQNFGDAQVSFSGKVSDHGKMFVNDKDDKNWMINNPETVKGHEGHHVAVKAHLDPAKNEIHVTSVKMAKGEMKDNMKKEEMQH
jgi:hypothetical protein